MLVFDRTLQSIAYKLVPHLYKEEIERQIAYYKERDQPYPPSLMGSVRFVSSEFENFSFLFFQNRKTTRKTRRRRTTNDSFKF